MIVASIKKRPLVLVFKVYNIYYRHSSVFIHITELMRCDTRLLFHDTDEGCIPYASFLGVSLHENRICAWVDCAKHKNV